MSLTPDKFLASIFVTMNGCVPHVNWQKALTGYIHHSSVPVAMAAYAADDPAAAKRVFSKLKLTQLVGKRPCMDGREAQALAHIGGVDLAYDLFCDYSRLSNAFAAHLEEMLERHGLWPCFFRDEHRGEGHYSVRPRGAQDDEAESKREMAAFRAAAKDLSEIQRILVATVICLYRGDADTTWCRGKGWTWHAADAIDTLSDDAVARADWHRLVALYPGW